LQEALRTNQPEISRHLRILKGGTRLGARAKRNGRIFGWQNCTAEKEEEGRFYPKL
jgi:hypothetical protein